MRSLSLAARGGFLEKALEDLRKVAWDRGPIRYGWMEKVDGTRMPLWHESEVALLAYAIQAIIANRGVAQPAPSTSAAPAAAPAPTTTTTHNQTMNGTKCPDCGAHAVIKKDGCSFCTSCGYIGACG